MPQRTMFSEKSSKSVKINGIAKNTPDLTTGSILTCESLLVGLRDHSRAVQARPEVTRWISQPR